MLQTCPTVHRYRAKLDLNVDCVYPADAEGESKDNVKAAVAVRLHVRYVVLDLLYAPIRVLFDQIQNGIDIADKMRDDPCADKIGERSQAAFRGFGKTGAAQLFLQALGAFYAALDVFRDGCFGIGADAVQHRLYLAQHKRLYLLKPRREYSVKKNVVLFHDLVLPVA